MALFDKSDAKFVSQLKNKHLRKLLLKRLVRARKIWLFVVVMQTVAALSLVSDDYEKDSWFMAVWVISILAFILSDFQIKAVKYINKKEDEKAEQDN